MTDGFETKKAGHAKWRALLHFIKPLIDHAIIVGSCKLGEDMLIEQRLHLVGLGFKNRIVIRLDVQSIG